MSGRLGHPIITFSDPLCRRDAILEIDVVHLPSPGGVQIGVNNHKASTSTWFDGCGRVHSLTRGTAEAVHLHGDRARQGDRLGVAYLASQRAVGFTLSGKLMGALVPLPDKLLADGAALRFFLRLDAVEATQVRLVRTRRAPLDLNSLLSSAATFAPRRAAEVSVLVRTVGPDSRAYAIPVDPVTSTVADLQRLVAPLLGCDGWRQVELRLGTELLTVGSHHLAFAGAGGGDESGKACTERTLREAGLVLDAESDCCHLHDVLASLPHLIS